jgi:hypothetical protein
MTYERLWARPELQIDLLITLGSPLAQPDIVFPKLHPARTREGALAAGARRWINIADPGDSSLSRPAARYFESIDADAHRPHRRVRHPQSHRLLGPHHRRGRPRHPPRTLTANHRPDMLY